MFVDGGFYFFLLTAMSRATCCSPTCQSHVISRYTSAIQGFDIGKIFLQSSCGEYHGCGIVVKIQCTLQMCVG